MSDVAHLLRPMRLEDIPTVLDAQVPAAIAGLSEVFPQDAYPFPREAVVRRWELEVADPDIACFVVQRDGEVVGFAAVQDDEVLHFGIALEQWGTGLAVAAHDELLQVLSRSGHDLVRLHVYADNDRGRRFWEKCGWRARTGRGAAEPSRRTPSC